MNARPYIEQQLGWITCDGASSRVEPCEIADPNELDLIVDYMLESAVIELGQRLGPSNHLTGSIVGALFHLGTRVAKAGALTDNEVRGVVEHALADERGEGADRRLDS